MNARQRRKQARRLRVVTEDFCETPDKSASLRHPDKLMSWFFPSDAQARGRWSSYHAAHAAGALEYAGKGFGVGIGPGTLWGALHQRASTMLREDTPRAWWFVGHSAWRAAHSKR